MCEGLTSGVVLLVLAVLQATVEVGGGHSQDLGVHAFSGSKAANVLYGKDFKSFSFGKLVYSSMSDSGILIPGL